MKGLINIIRGYKLYVGEGIINTYMLQGNFYLLPKYMAIPFLTKNSIK